MTFHWNWYSKKGKSSEENQDYAGIAVNPNFLVAVIADGISSRPKSGDLSRSLVSYLVDRAMMEVKFPDAAAVRRWIEDAFHEFKDPRSAKSSAAFIVACFTPEKLMFTVHNGDCRVGLVDASKYVNWQTLVHTLATATGPIDEDVLKVHEGRNQLTRSFGTKRFTEPALTEYGNAYKSGALLASDGFWAACPLELQASPSVENVEAEWSFEDDASRLLIQWRNDTECSEQAGPNFYVRIDREERAT